MPGRRLASSRLGAEIVNAERIEELEIAELRLRNGASLPKLLLPELEVLLLLRGGVRVKAAPHSPVNYHAPAAIARRLDTTSQVTASSDTQLLSVRSVLAVAGVDWGSVGTPVWRLPEPAADVARHLHMVLSARRPHDIVLLRGLGLAVLGWAHVSYGTDDARRDHSSLLPTWLDAVVSRLEQSVVAPSQAELAGIAGVTVSQLSRAFRTATGRTLGEYHRRLRVHRACLLMQDAQLPIARIAATTGFSDHAHFSRVFREVIGMAPRSYRSSLHSATQSAPRLARMPAIGRYAFSSHTAHGVAYDGNLVIERCDTGLRGWVETTVMPDVPLDSIAMHRERMIVSAKVPAGIALITLNFRGGSFEGEWRLAGKGTPIRGRRIK